MLLIVREKIAQARVEEERVHDTAAFSKELLDLAGLHLNNLLRLGECVLARHIGVSRNHNTSKDRQCQRDGAPYKDDQLFLNIQVHAFAPPSICPLHALHSSLPYG